MLNSTPSTVSKWTLVLVLAATLPAARDAKAFQSGSLSDSLPDRGNSWALLPSFYYTPETRGAGGVALQGFFQMPGNSPSTRSSNVLAALIYTQNKQIIALVRPRLYLQDRKYEVSGGIQFFRYPDRFYGIGNNTPDLAEESYTAGTFRVFGEALFRVRESFYVGPNVEVIRQELLETTRGGALEGTTVIGSAGGTAPAFGFQAVWDSRDSVAFPVRGSYHRLDATFARALWGSDYSYSRLRLDARTYVQLPRSHVMAFRGYAAIARGEVPFTQLPQLGGSTLMRGFYTGRYRDKTLLAAQAEYRMPVFWRFGVAGFASVGEVAPSVGLLSVDGLRVAAGGGLRFALVPSEKVNIRIDFAVASRSSGLYMALGEAF